MRYKVRFSTGLIILSYCVFSIVLSTAGGLDAVEFRPQSGDSQYFKYPLGVHFGGAYSGEKFVPMIKELGIRRTAIDLYWDQIEPKPGEYNWALS